MRILSNKLPFAIIAGGAVAAAFIVALTAFASSPFDIEFPIPELGNCTDKTECKAYCDDAKHHEECRTFAEKHGLGISKKEADDTLRELNEDGGPGNCAKDAKNPARACKKYCDTVAHIEECVAYAEEHGLMDGHELEEAHKVLSALKRGIKLPPQCKDAESCKETCEDPKDIKTARACFEFGKEAGLLPHDVSVEQAEKAFKALEEGTGPFKSFAEMRQCDNPPSDEVMQKCIEFAAQAGFMSPEEAEIVKKTGGKGPGNCRGREQCETYCREHDDECFAFAEQHGLVRPEDKQRMQEGAEKMKEAVDRAPKEVKVCIMENLPDLEMILSGQKMPSPQMGRAIQKCFESHFQNQPGNQMGRLERDPADGPSRMPEFPPEVAKCLEEKLGANFFEEMKNGRPSREMEEKMRACFESMHPQGQDGQDGIGQPGTMQIPPQPGDTNGMFKGIPLPSGATPHPEPTIENFPDNIDKEMRAIEDEFEKQFDDQYKEEFNQQYRQQYEQRYRQLNPQDSARLPTDGMISPPQRNMLPQGSLPPIENFAPPSPPPPQPQPTSMGIPLPRFMANVIQFILNGR